MATVKQIDANRRNAQRSTGPCTTQGKQASAQNALKSGVYAESEILFFENPDDLATLTAEYYDRFHPTAADARDLVDALIRNAWLLRRLARTEAIIFNFTPKDLTQKCEGRPPEARIVYRSSDCLERIDHIQRRINSVERNYHRTLKALQILESLQPPPAPSDPSTEIPAPPPADLPPNPIQPPDPEPSCAKLGSFPQIQKSVSVEPAETSPTPESEAPPCKSQPNAAMPPSRLPAIE